MLTDTFNHTRRGVTPGQYETAYDQLLSSTITASPGIRLALCTPFGLPVGPKKAEYAAWIADIKLRGQIVARLAQKYHAALVDFQPVFDRACQKAPAEHWIWDGIHPTYSGHQLMADEWVRAVRAYWPDSQLPNSPGR